MLIKRMTPKMAKRAAESLDSLSNREIIDAENLVIDAQLLIQELLNERDLTRSDLAKLTGVSKSRLTQLMGSEANPTLRTLAKIFTALDEHLLLGRSSKVNAQAGKWEDSELAAKGRLRSAAVPKSVLDEYIYRLKSNFFEASNENNQHEFPDVLAA